MRATEADTRITAFRRQAERLIERHRSNGDHRMAAIVEHAYLEMDQHRNPAFMLALQRMKRLPVTIEEFVRSPEFLGDLIPDWIWSDRAAHLERMNPDVLAGAAPVHQVLLSGATGTGKTTVCTITCQYQLYMLTCFDRPQLLYDLPSSTPIVFSIMSVAGNIAKRVIYGPLRTDFLAMPFVRRWVGHDKYKEAELDIEGHIKVVPSLASISSIVGQAIIGGVIDEVNFMSVVEGSKQVPGARGQGGLYDQAQIISRRCAACR